MLRRLMILLALALMLLQGVPACASEAAPGEVLRDARNRYEIWDVEGSLLLRGVPDGDVAFVLMKESARRLLLGYREEGEAWSCWLESRTAVPQGREEASFCVYESGERVQSIIDEDIYFISDGFAFSVIKVDAIGESYESIVTYRCLDGEFRLDSYTKNIVNSVAVEDGTLAFGGIGDGFEARVPGTVVTDIGRVVFDDLPDRPYLVADGRSRPVFPTKASPYALKEQPVAFERGQSYPVYSGPEKGDVRAADGKASVSTNSWIQVLGRRGDRVMIQYSTGERYRIGWIDADVLPASAQVEELVRYGDTATSDVPCLLTDDPLCSRVTLATVPAETPMRVWAYLGEAWAYVSAEIDGRTLWGFVPAAYLGWG